MTLFDRDKRRREFREKFRVGKKLRPVPSEQPKDSGLDGDFEEGMPRKAPSAWLTTVTYDPQSCIMGMISAMMGEHDDLNLGSTIAREPLELVNGSFSPGYYTIHCTFLRGPSGNRPLENPPDGRPGIPLGNDKPLALFQLKDHKNNIVDSLTLPVDPMFSPMTRARVQGLDRFDGTDTNKAEENMHYQSIAFAHSLSHWLDPTKHLDFLSDVYIAVVGNAWPMMDNIFDAKHGIGEVFEEVKDPSEPPVKSSETPKPVLGENLAPELVVSIKNAYDVIADGFVNGDISGGIETLKLSIVHGVKNKLGDVKEGIFAKVVGVAPPKLKELLQELERLEFKTLYNEAAMNEAVHDADFEIHEAIDRIVEALIDDNERASFEDTTAMGRIAHEIASRVKQSLQGDKSQIMEVLDVNTRGMGWLFASRYSDIPQFPEPSTEL